MWQIVNTLKPSIARYTKQAVYAHSSPYFAQRHFFSYANIRMQGPRNRQYHSRRGSARPRGNGTFGTGSRSAPVNVPKINQVISGAAVSIVLKADQPTGNEVQGFVAQVLTRGDHPRGIKVRLVDGRVGRVQRIVSVDEAKAGSEGLSGLGRNGESSGASNGRSDRNSATSAPTTRFTRRYHDMRREESPEAPPKGYNLYDFLPENHALRNDESSASTMTQPSATEAQMCPVCGEFEGDEIAVSRHVDTHFE